jgi:hypothetical protein
MQAKQLLLIAVGFLFIGLPSVYAQTAFLSFDSAVVETGERIRAQLFVSEKPAEPVNLAPWEPYFPKENQLAQSAWTQQEKGWKTTLDLIAFDSATLELPPLSIQLASGMSVQSNAARLTIIATPIHSTNLQDLSDIKDIHPEAKNWKDYQAWLWALLLLLLLALFVFLLQKKFKKPESTLFRSTQLSAKERAQRKLDLLEKEAPWKTGDLHAYYSALSEIVRTFLSEQYHCAAIHLGDEAVISLLDELPLSIEQKKILGQLLQTTALAKFAIVYPPDDVPPKALQAARVALQATEPTSSAFTTVT